MNIIKYIILGILQGITEPLPISSSGHLTLFKALFDTTIFESLNFEIIANFGSFIAIFILFYKDIVKLLKGFFKYIFKKDKNSKKEFLYCLCVIISTIPVGIFGLLFKDKIESITSILFLGFAFLITSLMLFIVRKFTGVKNDYDITIKDAIIIGLFQAVTIMPGISRSGTVLVACLICGLKREAALKYTFILYFPVSLAAMLLGVKDLALTPNLNDLILPYAMGMFSSLVVTFFSYKWMADWVKKGKLVYFSIYCLLLALFIFIYFH